MSLQPASWHPNDLSCLRCCSYDIAIRYSIFITAHIRHTLSLSYIYTIDHNPHGRSAFHCIHVPSYALSFVDFRPFLNICIVSRTCISLLPHASLWCIIHRLILTDHERTKRMTASPALRSMTLSASHFSTLPRVDSGPETELINAVSAIIC